MRLKPEQIQFIKSTIARHFGEDARLWLFGSRVDDAKRGGDVDLYVESDSQTSLFNQRLHCLTALEMGLPYPVDLVVNDGREDRPIYRIARAQGMPL
jgi:predicted nucleotidyltransferase